MGAVTRIVMDGLTAGEDYGCCSPEADPVMDDLVFTATPLLSHIRTTAHSRQGGTVGAPRLKPRPRSFGNSPPCEAPSVRRG